MLSHSRYLPKPPPYRYRPIVEPLVDGMTAFVDRLGEPGSPWYRAFAPLAEFGAEMLPRIIDPPQVT